MFNLLFLQIRVSQRKENRHFEGRTAAARRLPNEASVIDRAAVTAKAVFRAPFNFHPPAGSVNDSNMRIVLPIVEDLNYKTSPFSLQLNFFHN